MTPSRRVTDAHLLRATRAVAPRLGRHALWTLVLGAALLAPGPLLAQTPAQRATLATVDQLTGTIGDMATTLWDYSEIAMLEYKSAAYLSDLLEKEGFRVSRNSAGMPTAFVAEFGSGRPIIGILAEYDALPNIGNAVVPKKLVRDDGVIHGQGCGHNLFGAGSIGAAIALKRTMEARGIRGTIRLYGTPAEETLVGKTYMARDGLFDDLDAALDWHPTTVNAVSNSGTQANNNFTVEFRGQASHAAFDPWNGRSALDAVELMAHGVNMMREHIKPTARIHYVIPSGGEAPNVVPEYAKMWFYVRDADRPSVEAHYAWLQKIAEGAALATRTEAKVHLITGVHEYLYNRPIQELMQKNLELVGAPQFGEAEHQFAREMQAGLGLPQVGLSTTIIPLAPTQQPLEGGSTDVAEVSWITPTAAFGVATAGAGLPWHSWATSASHGVPGSSKAAVVAAKVLALTGLDLLTQPAQLEKARADFARKTAGRPYKSPIPEGQAPPVP